MSSSDRQEDVADSPDLPFGWNQFAQFSLAVVNQTEDSSTIRKETRHQFKHRESCCGFECFMRLDELCEPDSGYLVNDTAVIKADVHKIDDICANDFIRETGFVGLENQRATCSLNSLVQTLYHIPYFRKAVYQIPTEDDIPSQSVALALQILFFKLQHSDTSVATEDLTKSFGWSRDDSLTQHDVHELNMKFCANLENEMQGTIVEGTMRELFEGHFWEHVKCTDAVFKSEKTECFRDLQLDVKDCKDVYASFDKYTEVELLHGYNKYRADHFGLQKAEKGVLFIDFPPVLQLQLKRFEFHNISKRMVKINDRWEFPLQLDLDRDNGKYLSSEADKSVRNLYTLHSVFVHSGDIHGGHYYALIRPGLSNKWYKFNDGQVTEEDMERELEELYGGKNDGCSSAYMLTYIREGDKDKIFCDMDDYAIPEHLKVSMRKEKEDKRRYGAQANFFTTIQETPMVSCTTLLGCNMGNFVLLAADSRVATANRCIDAYGRVTITSMCMDNGYKQFWVYGGMFVSFSGWAQLAMYILSVLKMELPNQLSDSQRRIHMEACIRHYNLYYGDTWLFVGMIAGGYWRHPSSLTMLHFPPYAPPTSPRVCTRGSGSRFISDAEHIIESTPPSKIMDAMIGLLHRAILSDPASGGFLRFSLIMSSGAIVHYWYRPDDFIHPTGYFIECIFRWYQPDEFIPPID